MSLPGGPNPGDPAKAYRTSATNPPAGQTTDPALASLAADLADKEKRWRVVRHLRVLLLRLTDNDKWDSVKQIPKPSAVLDTYTYGSLARLAADLGFAEPTPKHMAFDWFGRRKVNWWGQNIDGSKVELEIATKLLAFLELSTSLKGMSLGPLPTDWTWLDSDVATGMSPFELLEHGTAPEIQPIRLEWRFDTGAKAVTASMYRDGTTHVFLIESPQPTRDMDWL